MRLQDYAESSGQEEVKGEIGGTIGTRPPVPIVEMRLRHPND